MPSEIVKSLSFMVQRTRFRLNCCFAIDQITSARFLHEETKIAQFFGSNKKIDIFVSFK